VPNDIGDPLLNSWIIAWDVHALLVDPFNLFNANIFYPLPNTLAYSEHLISTALLIMPLQLLFDEPIISYNLSLLLTFPLAAFGMYLLVFSWTNNRSAAFIAGFIFGFAPYRFAAIAHVQLLTFQWLPFVILMHGRLHKIITHHKRGKTTLQQKCQIALGLFLSLQLLASWYLAVYTLLIVGIFGVMTLFFQLNRSQNDDGEQKHATPYRQRFTCYYPHITPYLFSFFLIIPFAWPYLMVLSELRQSRPLYMALSLAANPTDYLAAAPFNTLFGPLTAWFRQRPGFTEENTLFIGIITPLLPIISWWVKQPELRFIRYTLTIILTLTLALTFAIPYSLLAALISPSTVIRVPARWIIPALFAWAGLAGLGYHALTRFMLKYPNKKRFFSFIPYFLTLLFFLETMSIPIPLAAVDNQTALNPAYHYLAQQTTELALIELPMYSNPEYPEVKRMVASTRGWWSLVNGYSGYTPPRQPELAQALTNFPDETSLSTLQQFAQTSPTPLMVLIHPGEASFNRSEWEDTLRWQAERDPRLLPLGQFAGDYLYQVKPYVPNQHQLATFNQIIALTKAQIITQTTGPALLLQWQTMTPMTTNYTIFVHLRAVDGFVMAQADSPPVNGHYLTSEWLVDEAVQDIHALPLVDYHHIAIGLYNPETGRRLSAVDELGHPLPDEAFIIHR